MRDRVAVTAACCRNAWPERRGRRWPAVGVEAETANCGGKTWAARARGAAAVRAKAPRTKMERT